jgi:extradiol dioxygenase family protein
MSETIFHLAFPVGNLDDTKAFYGDGLGCELGRESPQALIMNLYGHQLVAHVTSEPLTPQQGIYPRHFGLVFPELRDWERLLNRAQERQLPFYQQPKHRFKGELTEHQTFFLQDPFQNLLEFKFYHHGEAIFGARQMSAVGDRPEK